MMSAELFGQELAARVPRGDDGPAPLDAGAELAPGFTVVGLLRRGNDQDVYDVWSEERDCRCVAKVLRPDRVTCQRARAALLREGALLGRLTHPHIVRLYEIINEPEPALILETLTGNTLGQLLGHAPKRRLPLADTLVLRLQLCSAVRYLHRHGVLHLDLKPSNIVAAGTVATVLDLGIAQAPGSGRAGVGTPQYMAPEQVRGEPLSAATDIWGIGVVLFEALSGCLAFPASSEQRYEQGERQADGLHRHRRAPNALTAMIAGCLHPDRAQRPDVKSLALTLQRLLAERQALSIRLLA